VRVYAADWVLPVDAGPIEGGGVQVDGGRIVAVGPAADLEGEVVSFPGAVIVPGFVNAHSHLEYAVYAGFGDGLPIGPWLELHIARKRLLAWEDMLAIARLGAAECLASGVSTVADASFTGAAAVAADEFGLRGIVHLEVFGDGTRELETRFEPNRERVQGAFSDLLRLGVSPHAPYSCSADLYREALGLGLPVATHLAESEAEREWMTSGTGVLAGFGAFFPPSPGETGIRLLAAAGLLGPSVTAAHCVAVDAEEIDLLARHDVGVVHCPRSNALLGCGIAPVAALRAAGIRVGLGTDSPASTPSFDVFDEMRAAMSLARAHEADAGALSAAAALRLATLGSAEALALADTVGSLSPGKRADLCIVELSGTAFDPVDDPSVAVVLGGAPARVCRTIVDGMTRYARGGFEWRELRRSAAVARERMLRRPSSR
jgi:5-methylthioadenosine/S-adenosylhomocysteine deaminase